MASIQYQALVEPISTSAETTTVDRWFQPLSLPVWRRDLATAQQSVLAEPISESRETTTVDRWFEPLSEPRRPYGMSPAQQQVVAWSGFTPVVQTTSIGWLAPLNLPLARPPFAQAPGAVQPLSQNPEATTVDRWFQPLSMWPGQKTSPANQPAFTAPISEAPETTTVDRWLQPFGIPLRPFWSPSTPSVFWGLFTPTAAQVSIDWFEPLSDPTRRSTVPQYPDLAWSALPLAAPVTPSSAGWWIDLSQPYPATRGLSAATQLAFTSYVDMEPGPTPPAPTSIVTIPGPADGIWDADEQRRRWVEWSLLRNKGKKKTRPEQPAPLVVRPVLPDEPAPPAAAIPPVWLDTLLAANAAAVRSQQQSDAVTAAVVARLRKARDDDDDDDAISILFDD